MKKEINFKLLQLPTTVKVKLYYTKNYTFLCKAQTLCYVVIL